jgi:hypothetical protein
MSAKKYTQGPWEQVGNYVRSPLPRGQLLAEVFDCMGNPHSTEAKANASLMAAAQELLEVAEGILVDDMLQYLPDEYVAKVRTAIAKAKGE